jgi:hypothetical protein
MPKTKFKEPQVSQRGFAQFDPIAAGDASVKLYESSSSDEPRVWLKFEQDPSFAAPGGVDVAASLSLENAELLRDQLTWMLTNHYHRIGSSPT